MKKLVHEIYRSGMVRDAEGRELPIHSVIGEAEGEFLTHFISTHPDIHQVLEIGCGYGLSSVLISAAIAGRDRCRHVILDPLQDELFQGIGLLNLKRSGNEFYEFHAAPSEYFLPRLAEIKVESFDMVFIDGFHTFDHTLIDLFYSNRLIRPGGCLVVDDCHHASVAKAVAYFSRYPAYEVYRQSPGFRSVKGGVARLIKKLLPRRIAGYILPRNFYDLFYARTLFSRIVALKKVGVDERDWDWFEPF